MSNIQCVKPDNLTEEEWDSVLYQADEWGMIFEKLYPGTFYDVSTKEWNFSGNEEAVKTFLWEIMIQINSLQG